MSNHFSSSNSVVVQFNEEFGWVATAKKAPGTAFEKGQPIYLYEFVSIENVKLPEINGKPVAFVFFVRDGIDAFQIVFDFSPNHPDFNPQDRDKSPLAKEIAEILQSKLVEAAVNVQISCQGQLQKIGLWTVPCLLPYPLTKIVLELETNNIRNASKLLLDYCKPDFLETISTKWWNVAEFNVRRDILENALLAHKEGRYVLSITTLLPHVEGIVTDWIYTQVPENLIPWKIDSKTKKFHEIVMNKANSKSYQSIVNSTINFILGGPVLSTFKRWVDEIEKAFPNRHTVEHGRFDPCIYTEENSLKLILLIDTIYYIISKQSENG